MNSRLLILGVLVLSATVLSPSYAATAAPPAEIEQLPQYTVEERKLSPWLLWSYARAGQFECVTDRGEDAAADIVNEAQQFLEFLRRAHPEAAVPRDRKVLILLSSGRAPLFPSSIKVAGRVEQGDITGISLEDDRPYDVWHLRYFRRELVKAGFGVKSDFPWWYRIGLKNVLAHVRIDRGVVIVGEPPLSGKDDRFFLTQRSMRPFAHVLAFDETNPEFNQPEVRWQMECQATALVHVSMFHRHGYFAPALVRYIRDSRLKTHPTQAFEDAYGMRVTAVGPMIRGVVDLEASPTYYFDYAKVSVPSVQIDETRSVRKADVERFRALFGKE